MWIERSISEKILKAVKTRPAVLLTGARQTGKSSLLKKLFPSAQYVTFDHIRNIESAKTSPEFFIRSFKSQVILDEIQYVPEILKEIKVAIDQNRETYGKWILTGSQHFTLMKNISETLAGRIQIMHLETLSAEELRRSEISNYNDYVWKGGYPELWANKDLDFIDFFESYIKAYVERDLKNIINIKNLVDFRRLLKILASRVGQLLNYKGISNDVGVSDVTIRNWLSALQICGIVYLLPPYYSNIGKRFIKSPKIYFADTGLLSYFLGIESKHDFSKHILKGNIWENMVFNELVKTENFIPGENLFFYRDSNGVEIDFLIEKNKEIILIDAKISEIIEKRKLNFGKVIPILDKTYDIKCFVASMIPDGNILKFSSYYQYNPLYVNIKRVL